MYKKLKELKDSHELSQYNNNLSQIYESIKGDSNKAKIIIEEKIKELENNLNNYKNKENDSDKLIQQNNELKNKKDELEQKLLEIKEDN